MQNTERLFIFILIIVGLLFLYILSIFFAPGDHLSGKKIEPVYVRDGIDDSEDVELEEESQIPLFDRSNRGTTLNLVDSDATTSISNPTSFRDPKNLIKFERDLQKSKPAAIIPLSTRQSRLRATLLERGYENEKFLQFMMLGMDEDPLLDAEDEANKMIEQNQFARAISIYEELYEETDEENLQIKAAITEKIIEIGLTSGNIQIVNKYSSVYFNDLQAIVDIYKKTQIMKFSKGRDKIYNLEEAIKAGRSGSIIVFMQALKSGQLKPREIVTELKAAARMQNKNGYKMSNSDIAAAEKTSYEIFNNYSR